MGVSDEGGWSCILIANKQPYAALIERRDVMIPGLELSPSSEMTVSQGELVSWWCGANVSLSKPPHIYWTVSGSVYPGNSTVTQVEETRYSVISVLELVVSTDHSGATISCVLELTDDMMNTVTTRADYNGLTVTDQATGTKQLRWSSCEPLLQQHLK